MPAWRRPITCRRRSAWAAAGSLRMSTCFMPPTWGHATCPQDHPGRINKAPGHVGWHELATTDREAGFAFHTALFGWRKAEAMEVGEPVGTYQLFAVGDAVIGGMFTKPPAMPGPPFWLYYVNVGDIDAAVGRVGAGGGRILNGP